MKMAGKENSNFMRDSVSSGNASFAATDKPCLLEAWLKAGFTSCREVAEILIGPESVPFLISIPSQQPTCTVEILHHSAAGFSCHLLL